MPRLVRPRAGRENPGEQGPHAPALAARGDRTHHRVVVDPGENLRQVHRHDPGGALLAGRVRPLSRLMRVAARAAAEARLQTPPRGDALALLLACGGATTWREDVHRARSGPCPAHTLGFRRGGALAPTSPGTRC
jgi:hypothetical protein